MPAIVSIIPFVLHLMVPVPLPLQGFLNAKFTAYPLTPTNLDGVDSMLTFTSNLGGPGKLPVPMFAQLERSMSNKAKIYYQFKDEKSHDGSIKRIYLHSESCNEKISLIDDFQKATLFDIWRDDEIRGNKFHIGCSTDHIQVEEEAGSGDVETTIKKLALSSANGKSNGPLAIVLEDENVEMFALTGMITPYYMQDK